MFRLRNARHCRAGTADVSPNSNEMSNRLAVEHGLSSSNNDIHGDENEEIDLCADFELFVAV